MRRPVIVPVFHEIVWEDSTEKMRGEGHWYGDPMLTVQHSTSEIETTPHHSEIYMYLVLLIDEV